MTITNSNLKWGRFEGNIIEFVFWWNKQNSYLFNGGATIAYMQEQTINHSNGMQPTGHTTYVEYVIQIK